MKSLPDLKILTKMKKGPEAFMLCDDDGMGTMRCSTVEKAEKAFLELLKGDTRLKEFDKNKIQETTQWFCNNCMFYTLEEPVCIECGKDFKSNGRKTFVYYWNK